MKNRMGRIIERGERGVGWKKDFFFFNMEIVCG